MLAEISQLISHQVPAVFWCLSSGKTSTQRPNKVSQSGADCSEARRSAASRAQVDCRFTSSEPAQWFRSWDVFSLGSAVGIVGLDVQVEQRNTKSQAFNMELVNFRCCCPGPPTRSAVRRQVAPVAVAAPDKDTLQQAHNLESGANGFVPGLNSVSKRITQPKTQGASQAMLYATGLREEDLGKAQVRCSH